MRWTENETKFIPNTYAQCDFCDHDAKKEYRHVKKCHFCGKDVCYKCAVMFDLSSNLEDGSYSDDYPDYSCRPCWELGYGIRANIIVLRKEKELEEDALINQWIAKAKGKRDVA